MYYWTGGLPTPHPVREISAWGAEILSPDNFYPGTMIWLSLHDAADGDDGRGGACGGVWGQVIRHKAEGFCVEFLFESRADRLAFRDFVEKLRQRGVHETNGKKPKSPSGTVAD